MNETINTFAFLCLIVLAIFTAYQSSQLAARKNWMHEVQANFEYGERVSMDDIRLIAAANNLDIPTLGERPQIPTPFWRTSKAMNHSRHEMSHPVPMKFFHCVGNDRAWRIIIGHALVVFLYLAISFCRFLPAAYEAGTRRSRLAWLAIAFVFPFCALAGYATTILAGWYPLTAYFLKEWMCYIDVTFCVLFLVLTNHKHLVAVSDNAFRQEVADLIETTKPAELIEQLKERL